MYNFVIENNWEDDTLLELKVTAISPFIQIKQFCYTSYKDLSKFAHLIKTYLKDASTNRYFEFGKKVGKYTPGFSIEFFKMSLTGKTKIELDMEIDDVDDKYHRCKFFIEAEYGAIERFYNSLIYAISIEKLDRISLYQDI